MWLRPEYGFVAVATLVVLCFFSFLGGRFTAPNPQRPLITTKSTAAEIEKNFDLGTGGYTDTSCAPKGPNFKFPVCAWDYTNANAAWAVTLFIRQPQGSIAHNPPISEDRG